MSATDVNNPLRKFKLVFLGEQSGTTLRCAAKPQPTSPTNRPLARIAFFFLLPNAFLLADFLFHFLLQWEKRL